MARVNYKFTLSSIRPIDGLITFSKSPLRQLSMPYYDALVTLEVGQHLMKQILVDPNSAADLLYLLALLRLSYKTDNIWNPGRVLVGFNGSKTNSLGETMLLVLAGPVTTLIPLKVIDEPLSFNAFL